MHVSPLIMIFSCAKFGQLRAIYLYCIAKHSVKEYHYSFLFIVQLSLDLFIISTQDSYYFYISLLRLTDEIHFVVNFASAVPQTDNSLLSNIEG